MAQSRESSLADASKAVLRRKCACGQHTIAGGECESCRKENNSAMLRRATLMVNPPRQDSGSQNRNSKFETQDSPGVPSIVHEVLRSPGQPLDATTRNFFDSRFGHDFSRVRVHTDAQATESAQAINASAYTVGRDVVFDRARYSPNTNEGRQLLAHELTHVIQQTGHLQRSSISPPIEVGAPDDALEREAQQAAIGINADQDENPSIVRRAPAARLQRHVAITGLDEAGPGASLTGGGKEQELWQCMKANPDVCAPDKPLTWANFKGTPNQPFDAFTVAPVKSGPLPSEVCAQRILGRPAKPSIRFRTVLDESKSFVREPFKSANDPTKNGCKPLLDDCQKVMATPGRVYNSPVMNPKCAASAPMPNVQATTLAECTSVIGAACAKRQIDESARLLDHEVGHFDISCALARKANAALDAGGALAAIETAVEKKRDDLYKLYDADTDHGCKPAEQAAWKSDIANDLAKQKITLP